MAVLAVSSVVTIGSAWAGALIAFTNCGQTGRTGPSYKVAVRFSSASAGGQHAGQVSVSRGHSALDGCPAFGHLSSLTSGAGEPYAAVHKAQVDPVSMLGDV